MFGHHHEAAQATVLLAEDVTGKWEDVHHVKIEFVLEVHPPNGQAFRAKATHHFIMFTHYPQVGDVVNVKYDPKSLEVSLDLKDDIRYGAKGLNHQEQVRHQQERAQRDALLSAPPGTLAASPLLKGINPADLDPELLALVQMEEAERLAAQQAAPGAQMPTGFPGMAAAGQPQAALGLAEAQALHRTLEFRGATGQAKILRKQQTGQAVQQFVPFFVEVLVKPDTMEFPFECSFTTWIDAGKGMLTEGHIVPIKYDPQNTAHAVFPFSA